MLKFVSEELQRKARRWRRLFWHILRLIGSAAIEKSEFTAQHPELAATEDPR